MQAGTAIGRFEIEEPLGQGGMATVFKVRHRQLDSVYAMKLLRVGHPSLARRLLQEGRIQASLRHKNVVNVIDVVEHEGLIGLLLEYVQGGSLEDSLADGPMEPGEALAVFRQILAGVGAAHAAGVTHRDLKPANILLTVEGDEVIAKVTDFGIAKVLQDEREGGKSPKTRADVAMGTPGYMAPEQIRDSSGVDHRADIFALGAILYEMLTGESPFADMDAMASMNRTLAGRYRSLPERLPQAPAELGRVIDRALSLDREDRFADCAELERALAGARVGPTLPRPAPTEPDSAAERIAQMRRAFEATAPSRSVASSPTLAPMPEGAPAQGTRSTWIEPARTRFDQPSLVEPEDDEDQPTADTIRSSAVAVAGPARSGQVPVAAGKRRMETLIEVAAEEKAKAEEEESAVNGRDAAGMFAELFWDMARAIAYGLARTLRYGAIPALLLAILAFLAGMRSAAELDELKSSRHSQALALNRTMDDSLVLVPQLVEAGANPELLANLQRKYEEAATPEAKVAAARELSGVMTQQLALLAPPTTPEEVAQRRELEAALARLERDASRFAEADRRLEAGSGSIGARIARITGQT